MIKIFSYIRKLEVPILIVLAASSFLQHDIEGMLCSIVLLLCCNILELQDINKKEKP